LALGVWILLRLSLLASGGELGRGVTVRIDNHHVAMVVGAIGAAVLWCALMISAWRTVCAAMVAWRSVHLPLIASLLVLLPLLDMPLILSDGGLERLMTLARGPYRCDEKRAGTWPRKQVRRQPPGATSGEERSAVLEVLLGEFPVDEVVEERLDVLRPSVA
jgi:hypothetical protein